MPTNLQENIAKINPSAYEKHPAKESPWSEIINESKALVKLAVGTSVNSFCSFFIPVCTVLIVGHKGKVFLAAIGLAISVCNISGLFLVIGLASVTETLCSQAYGAKDFRRFGILIQRTIIITFVSILPTCALWINMDKVLVHLGQDKAVALHAGQFAINYIPGLIFFILYNVLSRYLACQNIVYPIFFGSFLAFVVNIVFCYLFVYQCDFGFQGAAFALDLAYLSFSVYVIIVILLNKIHQKTWHGWSNECFLGWMEHIQLGAFTVSLTLMEFIVYELGIIVVGTFGSTALAVLTATMYIVGTIYFIVYGISIGTAIRTGNYLGEGNYETAKVTVKAGLLVSLAITIPCGIVLVAAKDLIPYIFTSDRNVAGRISKVILIVIPNVIFDGLQTTLMGAVRGLGYQKYGALISFISYICISIPFYLLLILQLHLTQIGMWLGLLVGILCQITGAAVMLRKVSWKERSNLIRETIAAETRMPLEGDKDAFKDASFNKVLGASLLEKDKVESIEESEFEDGAEGESLLTDDKTENLVSKHVTRTSTNLEIVIKVSIVSLFFLLVAASLAIKILY